MKSINFQQKKKRDKNFHKKYVTTDFARRSLKKKK